MCQNGYARLWMLRWQKGLGASSEEMLDVYEKQIRCVLELAVAVWQPGLTQQETIQLERVQKSAFSIMLGDDYRSYEGALDRLERIKLSDRRYDLCLNFAKKANKSKKFTSWFSPQPNLPAFDTRSEKPDNSFKPVKTRTDRYERSPLPYLTEMLNVSKMKKQSTK